METKTPSFAAKFEQWRKGEVLRAARKAVRMRYQAELMAFERLRLLLKTQSEKAPTHAR